MNAHAQRALNLSPASTILQGWALLTIDDVKLAVPQRDIVTIGLVSALQQAQDVGNAIGWFMHNEERRLVYCLDRNLVPVSLLAKAARVCVLVRTYERIFGLIGTQVVLLPSNADLLVQPLPSCLVQSGSPLTGFALHHDSLVLSIDVNLLADYLVMHKEHHG